MMDSLMSAQRTTWNCVLFWTLSFWQWWSVAPWRQQWHTSGRWTIGECYFLCTFVIRIPRDWKLQLQSRFGLFSHSNTGTNIGNLKTGQARSGALYFGVELERLVFSSVSCSAVPATWLRSPSPSVINKATAESQDCGISLTVFCPKVLFADNKWGNSFSHRKTESFTGFMADQIRKIIIIQVLSTKLK